MLKSTKNKCVTAGKVQAILDRMLGRSSKTETTGKAASPKSKLKEIARLVAKALKPSTPSADELKEVLEKIQKLLGGKTV